MITESISTNVFVSTILFFLIVVLFRKILLGDNLNKHEISYITYIIFYMVWWYQDYDRFIFKSKYK